MEKPERCPWCLGDPLYIAYHDTEWGVPCHDDQELFERLILEGFQAGLSWITILRKRENFRAAFDNWDVERLANYGPNDIFRLLNDPGIVRNRLKINATVTNAQAYLRLREEFDSFDTYLWSFVGGEPMRQVAPATPADVPTATPEAKALSKDLKQRGFAFVGPTICYALMQSVGMVNDHIATCFLANHNR